VAAFQVPVEIYVADKCTDSGMNIVRVRQISLSYRLHQYKIFIYLKTKKMTDLNADPLSHDHYKNLGEWCPLLKADGATLSLLANSLWSLERSLHDE
jgi:hypothetical protein